MNKRKQNRSGNPKSAKYTKTQEEALRELRSSKRAGFGIFSSNADEDLSKPPDRMYLIMRLPVVKWLPRLTFRTPEAVASLIEDLMAHRRHVWPEAEEVNVSTTLDDEV